jgi:4,5-DOPA dioxygenase extradiol
MSRKTFIKFCSLLLGGTLLPIEAKTPKRKPMPALFFGHGSPMNIVEDNNFTRMLKQTASTIPIPKAILIISAHWVDTDTKLSTNDKAETIYDFGGFPDELYTIKYPSHGSKLLAHLLDDIVVTSRGLDHGAWSILTHMYPNADIPTMQLSINKMLSLSEHYALGKQLAKLREHDVLIIGSGGITHNLRYYDFDNREADVIKSAKIFDTYVKESIVSNDFASLLSPDKAGVPLRDVHPSLEHYIPLLYIAGMVKNREKHTFIYEGFQNAAFSMRSWQVG